MLDIQNLHVEVDGKLILKNLSLTVRPGEVHAIMGPNGSGKSTLANVLAGKENYKVISGDILYQGESILSMKPEIRAQKGVFLGFQYPVEIPGVSNILLLKTAVNTLRRARGQKELDAMDFMDLVQQKIKFLHMNSELLYRSVNEGFSGGEKKRNEILQMLLMEPSLMVLDETDSGLDIDALRLVSEGVNSMRSPTRSVVMITHYQRLLDYIVPDHVHVLCHGSILKSGDCHLASELELKGYNWLLEKQGTCCCFQTSPEKL